MKRSQGMVYELRKLFDKVTDWVLILIGLALIGKALLAVDVALARYGIIGFGALLVVLGFCYRHRRKQRYRQ